MGTSRRSAQASSGTVAAGRPRGAGSGHSDGARQRELLEIAAELFAGHGYAATTVRDIATAAGISSGSLYHHFTSKESMLQEILSSFVARTLAGLEAVLAEDLGPLDTLTRLIEVSLRSMVDDRAAVVVYQSEAQRLAAAPGFEYLSAGHRRFEQMWTGVLRCGIAEGAFRPDLDAGLVYRLARDGLWTAARWWRPGGTIAPEQIVEQFTALLVCGIAADS